MAEGLNIPKPAGTPERRSLSSVTAIVLLISLALALFLIRLTAPSDLADGYHQERAAAYVMDALRNGNWICQYGLYGEVSSKPPMFTWLAALASLILGQASWFTLILPGALSTLAVSLLLYHAGRRDFSPMAGFFAAALYLLSPLGAKQMALARVDGLFAFTVAWTAFCGFASWKSGRGWTWFWLAAAAATLTKGPLGLCLGAAGLTAVFWERRSGAPAAFRGSHLPGILVFMAIIGGWFGAAYWQIGGALVDKMLGQELIGQAVGKGRSLPLQEFYKPTGYFLRHFAPWCVLAFLGLWRAYRCPAAQDRERRFERFLICWLVIGLIIFSSAAHQRPDLIFPVVPPAALLAGRELARWLANLKPYLLRRLCVGATILGLGIVVAKYHVWEAKKLKTIQTMGMKAMARTVRQAGGNEFPLTYTDSPFALQFYLNTKRPLVSLHEAARLLRRGPAAFVVVTNRALLQGEAAANTRALYELAHWDGGGQSVHIMSNHPRLEWTRHMLALIEPIQIEMEDIRLLHTQARDLVFTSSAEKGLVKLSAFPPDQKVRIKVLKGTLHSGEERLLQPGETWSLEVHGAIHLQVMAVTEKKLSGPTPDY